MRRDDAKILLPALIVVVLLVGVLGGVCAACGAKGPAGPSVESTEGSPPGSSTEAPAALTEVKFMLDWVPNTNHTGIYVAAAKGYFKEAGLDVQIVEPGEVYPEAAVAGGAADFGISFQEAVTLARIQGAPLVSIAAVLQHNTSGFASLASLGVTGPRDFEGLRYGSWGYPSEIPTLKALMGCSGAGFDKLELVTVGFADSLALLVEKRVDLVWIFYGWDGIQAKEKGIDLSMVMMSDYLDCVPDFYTPVVIAGESVVNNRPELATKMLEALSRGYTYAAKNPDEAADILLAAAPELDSSFVRSSQRWISDQYIAEAPRWGEQEEGVWRDYADWMVKNGVADRAIVVEDAFTNRFLPQ